MMKLGDRHVNFEAAKPDLFVSLLPKRVLFDHDDYNKNISLLSYRQQYPIENKLKMKNK